MGERCSIFVVPDSSLEELGDGYKRWGEAVDQQRDDVRVLGNRLYRRAEELALERVLLEGQSPSLALLAVSSYLRRQVPLIEAKDVFASEDCHQLARSFAEQKAARSEAKLVHAMWRHKMGPVEQEHVREAWHALCEAVDRAVARDAGVFWFRYDDEAEEKLAEKRRQEEARRAEIAARPPLSPEERARNLEAAQRDIEALVRRGHELEEQEYQRQFQAKKKRLLDSAKRYRRTIHVVPAVHIPELEPMAPGARRSLDVMRALDRAAAERAHESFSGQTLGERASLEYLWRRSAEDHRFSLHARRAEVHGPEDARVFRLTVTWWRESYTRRWKAIDKVAFETDYRATHEESERVYDGLCKMLDRAHRRKRPSGLVLTTLPLEA